MSVQNSELAHQLAAETKEALIKLNIIKVSENDNDSDRQAKSSCK
ncbi:MAG: hypothetical protein RPR40_12820 [Bermanella sp.]